MSRENAAPLSGYDIQPAQDGSGLEVTLQSLQQDHTGVNEQHHRYYLSAEQAAGLSQALLAAANQQALRAASGDRLQ